MVDRKYAPIDLSGIRTYSVSQREHKVHLSKAAKLPSKGASAAELFESLPGFLGAQELRALVDAVLAAVNGERPVALAMGAHVVKVGCSPIIIDLLEREVITSLSFNGATAIHDVELALLGATSEEVGETIRDGSFGMVRETMAFFSNVCALADKESMGLGESIGRLLWNEDVPYRENSLLAAASRLNIPVTVHVALGTDTIHMCPDVDGTRLGEASMRDFRLACSIVADLGASLPGGPGGVWLNVGSAVVLPEVFLKAVSVARNLGANLDEMVTGNLDMQRHYRPRANVVSRPVRAGMGHEVVGHHEILLPLFRQAVIDRL